MSQTAIPKGVLSKLQNPPSPDKTRFLPALTALRLWQIWFDKAGNKNEKRCVSSCCPRWEDRAALCVIGCTSCCKWIKKIHRFCPPSVHTSHWCNQLKCPKTFIICQSRCDGLKHPSDQSFSSLHARWRRMIYSSPLLTSYWGNRSSHAGLWPPFTPPAPSKCDFYIERLS